jgi:hypothetical protein
MVQIRKSRLVVGVVLGIICLCVVWIVATNPAGQAPQTVNGERLADALARYSRDIAKQGQGIPVSVSLETLLQAGYLTPEDAKPFGDAKVIFYATADTSKPDSILIEARMPDGSVQVVLADGSVHQYSQSRLEELRSNALSFDATAPRQKLLSSTNSLPSGETSGRTN